MYVALAGAAGFLILAVAILIMAIRYPLLMMIGLVSALLVYLYPTFIASSFIRPLLISLSYIPSAIKSVPIDWKYSTLAILKGAKNVTESFIGGLI